MLLIALLRLPAPVLTAIGLLLIGSHNFISLPVPFPGSQTLQALSAGAMDAYLHKGWLDMLAFRWHETQVLIFPLLVLSLPRTLGVMLCGAAAWRSGLFENRRRLWWWVSLSGSALGVAGTILHNDEISIIPLALAYAAVILLWNPRAPWVTAAGRMALTNYLIQSIAFGFIFYGYGWGKFGQWGVGFTCLAGLVFYIAQLATSHLWLKQFHFGPFEWLWRSISYLRWQPLLRGGETTFPHRALFTLLPATFLLIPLIHMGASWLLSRLGPHWGWRGGHLQTMNWMGVVPVFAGLALLAWILAAMLRAVPTLPSRIRVGLRPAQIVQTGPYAVMRHPMYVAEACLWMGVSLLAGSPVVAFLLACGTAVDHPARRESAAQPVW